MYRTIVYLGLVVATLCLLGLAVPQSISALTFLLPSGIYAAASLVLAAALAHFGVAASFRGRGYKLGLGIAGMILVVIALLGTVYPMYFGLFKEFVRPANLLVLLLNGINCLIAALEHDRPALAEELREFLVRERSVAILQWRHKSHA